MFIQLIADWEGERIMQVIFTILLRSNYRFGRMLSSRSDEMARSSMESCPSCCQDQDRP